MLDNTRQHYRVNTTLMLGWQLIDGSETTDDPNQQLLQEMGMEVQRLLHNAPSADGTLSKVMQLLNQRITLLGDLVTGDTQNLNLIAVNISGSGIAFHSSEPLSLDDVVKIRLTLPQTSEILTLKAKVIGCDPVEGLEGEFNLRCHFLDDQDAAQASIFSFVNKVQTEELERRGGRQGQGKPALRMASL